MHSEEGGHAHTAGHAPVEQRRFLQVANAVGIERHVIVAQQHLARDLHVHAVGIIQQRRAPQGEAAVKGQPQQQHGPQG